MATCSKHVIHYRDCGPCRMADENAKAHRKAEQRDRDRLRAEKQARDHERWEAQRRERVREHHAQIDDKKRARADKAEQARKGRAADLAQRRADGEAMGAVAATAIKAAAAAIVIVSIVFWQQIGSAAGPLQRTLSGGVAPLVLGGAIATPWLVYAAAVLTARPPTEAQRQRKADGHRNIAGMAWGLTVMLASAAAGLVTTIAVLGPMGGDWSTWSTLLAIPVLVLGTIAGVVIGGRLWMGPIDRLAVARAARRSVDIDT